MEHGVTAIGLGFVWWFGGPPTPFGWVIVVLSLFILTLLAFGMTRWALAGTAWAFWEPSYSADKIESLRAAATSLRDILWGLNVPDADARLQAFRTVGEDFIYEQPFKSLLPRIERNATRMRIMAALPPAGPQAPDPAAFTQCMQDGHAAVEDLMRLTAKWVNRDRGQTTPSAPTASNRGKQAYLNRIAELRQKVAALRVEMEKTEARNKPPEKWAGEFHALENEIAQNIEAFATPAEAAIYRTRGNVIRRMGPGLPAHQLYIDLCIHDLDYLRDFVKAYSRKDI